MAHYNDFFPVIQVISDFFHKKFFIVTLNL